MKPIADHLFKKIVDISKDINDVFSKKGIAIPIRNENGSISLGMFTVIKTQDGFYSILDYAGIPVAEKINLPQTAILLANNLALGKFLDTKLLQKDQKYGYALFEESVCKRSSTKSSKTYDIAVAKGSIARLKKEYYKKDIVSNFEKLRKLV